MKYKHKPTIVEAFKWTGGPDQLEDPKWLVDAMVAKDVFLCDHPTHKKGPSLHIRTLEGNMTVTPGDYIIKGIKDEIYSVRTDIFETSYDKVGE